VTQPLPIPQACALALDAVLLDPLEPGAEAEAHLRTCLACSEARVAYLAQEMGTSVGSVKAHIFHAIRNLTRHVKGGRA